MIPFDEYDIRQLAWKERIEHIRLQAEAQRLLRQTKLETPLKALLNQLWNRLVPPRPNPSSEPDPTEGPEPARLGALPKNMALRAGNSPSPKRHPG